MEIQENTISKPAAYRILLLLLLLTGFASAVMFLSENKIIAYSVLLGGLAFVLPNLYFVSSIFRDEWQHSPRVIVHRFYAGEIGKILLTGLFFTVCFVLVEPLHGVAFFAAYLLVMVMNLVALALFKQRKGKTSI